MKYKEDKEPTSRRLLSHKCSSYSVDRYYAWYRNGTKFKQNTCEVNYRYFDAN